MLYESMNIDFIIAVAVIGIIALILHYKSHVKFVALGVFIGLALIQITPLESYFDSGMALSIAQVVLLAVPALLLGINHSVDKRKGSFIWKVIFVLVFTLFFLSSIIQVLPAQLQTEIMERSIVGWQILDNYEWFMYAAAILVLVDSVHHRTHADKAKKKKK